MLLFTNRIYSLFVQVAKFFELIKLSFVIARKVLCEPKFFYSVEMPGGRTRAETKVLPSDIAGLHLCEECMKCNEERLKELLDLEEKRTIAEEVREMNEAMKEMKKRLETITNNEEILREQQGQIQDLRAKIESFSKDSIDKLEETRKRLKNINKN